MRHNQLALYVHLVWATWDRLPLIQEAWERRLQRLLEAKAREAGCVVLAIAGMDDHVHTLLSLPGTLPVAELVKLLKGASSHFMNGSIATGQAFKWQGGYGAFSVSERDLPAVAHYIRLQRQHHSEGGLIDEWEPPAGPIGGTAP